MNLYVRMALPVLKWLVVVFCTIPAATAAGIGEPAMLVATERLAQTPYRQTVLAVVPVGEAQHFGLIVNRPTDATLGVLFPEHKSAHKVVDPLFFGGPELTGSVFAAVRAPEAPSAFSLPLMAGLFLVTDRDTIDRLMDSTPNDARYFTGVVVWASGELAQEVDAGLWHVVPANPRALFDAHPLELWHDLVPAGSGVVAMK